MPSFPLRTSFRNGSPVSPRLLENRYGFRRPDELRCRMVSGLEFGELLEKYNEVRLQFITAELDLGITFCQCAFTAREEAIAERNERNAARAYQSAVKTLGNLSLDGHPDIAVKLRRLSGMLPKTQRRSTKRPRRSVE